MKYILFVCAILCAGTSFSQSKKKQIEILTHQLDSVNQQLSSVNMKLDSVEQVNNHLIELRILQENTIGHLKKTAELQNEEVRAKLTEINQLKETIRQLEAKLKPAAPKVEKTTSTKPNDKPSSNHTNLPSNNPFGSGEPSVDIVPGRDSGTEDGIGFGSRSRLSNVDVQNISIETDAKIYYKLTIDAEGNVVAFTHYGSKTTTKDLTLINKIGYEIKKQVKYSKKQNAPLMYVDYTVNVKANE